MENTFFVSVCRFHTKDNKKLVVIGYFKQNLKGNQELIAMLDETKLVCEIEEKELSSSPIQNNDGLPISKQYFLWISLPDNWKMKKSFRLLQINGIEERKVLDVPVKQLQKYEKRLPKYVDKGTVEEDGFRISGWYIDDGTTKVDFLDQDRNKIDVTIKRKSRPDVKKVYPENEEEEIIGFWAKFKGKVPKKVQVCFSSESKYADYTVILLPSVYEKITSEMDSIFRKSKAYYRKNGFQATVKRVVDKLTSRKETGYEEWFKKNYPSKGILEQQRQYKFSYTPVISIVVPLYKTPEKYLVEMIESVRKQSYPNWELCLSDGSGSGSPIQSILKKYEKKDGRIKVAYHSKALNISENTNAALKISTGEYIAFADHDDLLAPNALFECVSILNQRPETEIIYTDEDKVDMAGKHHFLPHFKSDFNIDMLRNMNYICHLFVVKRELYQKVGMLNSEFDGAQDYDFVLRCVEKTDRIIHIPQILYHWRTHKSSTSENPESKQYAFTAGKKAIQAHCDRLGLAATVEEGRYKGVYRVKYELTAEPLVSIIIPNKDHIEDLDKCLQSFEERSTYKNIEYIIVENNSQEKRTFSYYKDLEKRNPKAKVVFWDGKGFNYPAINMYGVEHSAGEYLLFLNNDTEIVNNDCVEELLGYCQRKEVGAVGARLYYEDGTIQHAGVIVGLGGVAGHAFVGLPHEASGYFHRIIVAQDYSAVTAACVLVKRKVFEEVGGFDEGYAVAFNDVDLCLKIREAGYLVVYNPYAELMHYESKSRGYEDTAEKVERFNSEIKLFQKKWKHFLEKGDPYYNPNLTLDKQDFSLSVIPRTKK